MPVKPLLTHCGCGHVQPLLPSKTPFSFSRRRLIGAIGGAAAIEALTALLELETMTAQAADGGGKPEKTALVVGMIPTICALPLVAAQHFGLFKKYGLETVTFVQSGSPRLLADQLKSGGFDLSQQYMPMPLLPAITARSTDDVPVVVSILGQNGCSLVMALKHKETRDPKNWRAMRLGVPVSQSHHALLLRYFLAEHGLDPDIQLSFRVVPSDEFILQLKAGLIDGFFASEPNGQQAVFEGVGYIHTLSQAIWPGHPCCALTAQGAWVKRYPNTFAAVQKAMLEAAVIAADVKKHSELISILATPAYLNRQEVVIEPVLSGQYADGLGDRKVAASRVAFDPFPYPAPAIWMLTQWKRWGMVRGDIRYAEIARRVMLNVDMATRLSSLRLPVPTANRVETIMGRPFDPTKPDDYIAGFKIRR